MQIKYMIISELLLLLSLTRSPTSLWDMVWTHKVHGQWAKIVLMEGAYAMHWIEVEFVPYVP